MRRISIQTGTILHSIMSSFLTKGQTGTEGCFVYCKTGTGHCIGWLVRRRQSTVAKLAANFILWTEEEYCWAEPILLRLNSTMLMKNFSIVFQDVVLFNNTIMENIRVGKKDATDEEVIAAAKAAQCDEFISKLSDGYQTVIGENGSTLSGGECQRLSIARALLKDAPVILLDEATASLDVDKRN